jgi:hypothetical protein
LSSIRPSGKISESASHNSRNENEKLEMKVVALLKF